MENNHCGKCQFHLKDDEDWYCDNPESENYGLITEFKDTCNDWEERDE